MLWFSLKIITSSSAGYVANVCTASIAISLFCSGDNGRGSCTIFKETRTSVYTFGFSLKTPFRAKMSLGFGISSIVGLISFGGVRII